MMNEDSFSFVVYMIHVCANTWDKKPSEVYAILQSKNCISGFLVPHYDILHTQSAAYVVDDITEYLKVRGIFL